MDIINTSLNNLKLELNNSIKKLKDEYEKTILDTSNYYKNIFTEFDKYLLEYFPQINDFPNVLPQNIRYNPSIIIEYDNDRKPKQILRKGDRDWNEDIGYLPNRKIMYSINLIYFDHKDIAIEVENLDISNIYRFISTNWLIYIRKGINYQNIIKLELHIDNYLNIQPYVSNQNKTNSNVYFCFNKIPFPEVAFTTKRLKNLIVSNINNIINNYNINSKDNELDILNKAKYYIPDNYEEIYNYYDGYRKLSGMYNTLINENKDKLKVLGDENELYKNKNNELEKELEYTKDMLNKYKSLVHQ